MKSSTISRSVLAFCGVLFGLAVMIGRSSRPEPLSEPAPTQTIDREPESVLIATGSVEHRLRAMEAQLVEMRNKIESLEAAKERDPLSSFPRYTAPDPGSMLSVLREHAARSPSKSANESRSMP
jgi:hypothetical protein